MQWTAIGAQLAPSFLESNRCPDDICASSRSDHKRAVVWLAMSVGGGVAQQLATIGKYRFPHGNILSGPGTPVIPNQLIIANECELGLSANILQMDDNCWNILSAIALRRTIEVRLSPKQR